MEGFLLLLVFFQVVSVCGVKVNSITSYSFSYSKSLFSDTIALPRVKLGFSMGSPLENQNSCRILQRFCTRFALAYLLFVWHKSSFQMWRGEEGIFANLFSRMELLSFSPFAYYLHIIFGRETRGQESRRLADNNREGSELLYSTHLIFYHQA